MRLILNVTNTSKTRCLCVYQIQSRSLCMLFLVCPSPFILSNILTRGQHKCFPTPDLKDSIRQIPQTSSPGFHLAACSVCLSLRYQTEQSAKNDGHALADCSCTSHSFCLCFTAAENHSFGPEDLLCETVHNDIKTFFSSRYRKIDNTESLVLGLKEKVVQCHVKSQPEKYPTLTS